jgi:hypothetical protein
MPNPIDLSKDPFFVKEFARARMLGFARGFERGFSIGKARGEAIVRDRVIKSLLETERFLVEEIAAFIKVPLTLVLEVQKQLNSPKKKGQTKEK